MTPVDDEIDQNDPRTGSISDQPYAKVYRRLVRNIMFRNPDLSWIAKTLAIYVLICPESNRIGCFSFPESLAAHYLGTTEKKIRRALAELETVTGFVQYDQVRQWLLIPNFLRWNMPRLPNQQTTVITQIRDIPRGFPLYSKFLDAVYEYRDEFPERVKAVVKEMVIEDAARASSEG